jgi:spermidine synthase
MTFPRPGTRHLFFAIFAISGFSGLIYEAIWSHYLKLFLGHAAYAQTLVLVIFMGGMALGSWGMARYSTRVPNLLLGYALVEGIIGLLGLVFHRTSLGATSWLFDSVLPNVDSATAAHIVKWTLGALLILPQSVLLGMTFPLMSGAIVRRFPERSGETLAMLYFTNSLGAAVGVLVSGFVLIGLVGLPGTIMTAGLLNVLLALFVWGVARYRPDTVVASLAVSRESTWSVPQSTVRWLMIGAALTGVASFLYEIAWIRMLSLVLGSSTHSFEMMLSAFILGIALGGFWVHRRIDSLRDPVRFLAIILAIMAVVALLSLPVYSFTFDLMAYVMTAFSPTEQGYVGISLSSHAIAMLVMIPTTFFCGMTLPVITHVLVRGGSGEHAIGAVYAWNTAGAILGVIIAVHLLMPVVGLKGVVLVGAALQLLLAVAYWSMRSWQTARFSAAVWPALVGVVTITLAGTLIELEPAKLISSVFRSAQARQQQAHEVLFLGHGKTATISLVNFDGLVSISTNGKPDAAIEMGNGPASEDEITMVLTGALASALHAHPRQAAVIGFGSGLTSEVLLTDPRLETVDTIEIEPFITKAARIGYMPRVSRTFEDPRSRIYYEDAKTFFAVNRKKYDVIVSEPSNPWVSGVSSLFSAEFYDHITRYLQPSGILVQWIQIYETDLNIVLSIVKALAPRFSDFAIYTTDASNLLIVAVPDGTVPALREDVFSSPATRAELARVGIHSLPDIQSRYLGNKRLLLPLVNATPVPANSDYFPFVDLNAVKQRILRRNAAELAGLQTLPIPFFELTTGSMDTRARTLPSPNGIYARDRMTADAVAIHSALLRMDTEGVPELMERELLALYSPADRCVKPHTQRAWLRSAFEIAATTSAPLSAAELQPMWKAISELPCARALQSGDRVMLELFAAVARRDIRQTVALGESLFATDYEFARPSHMLYALLATSASAIATGQPQLALDLIAARGGTVSKSPAIALALRWLAAIATDQVQTGARVHTPRLDS